MSELPTSGDGGDGGDNGGDGDDGDDGAGQTQAGGWVSQAGAVWKLPGRPCPALPWHPINYMSMILPFRPTA